MTNTVKYIVVFFLALWCACNSPFVYEKQFEFTDQIWPIDEKVDFSFFVADTLSKYDVFIDVRHLAEYPYQNMWVFMDTREPSGTLLKDTIELKLASSDGRWLGKTASGSLIAHHIQIAKNKTLSPGQYTFSFWNGLREEHNLPHFNSIGLSIVKPS